ncbi:MAG: hypothetical protein VYD24_05690 [Bacteroidota bacterium]|nr:hypothetical protein [Bacteroidota bacterium]
MMQIKNTILCCLCLAGLMLLFQCTSKADTKTTEDGKNKEVKEEPTPNSPSRNALDEATCHIGEFDMFSTTIDSADNPVFGEQNIDMKCRWNEDGTIIRNTAGIEQRGSWTIVGDSVLIVRIDSLFETKGSLIWESPAYDTSIIQQCDDHHLILTSSSNGYTSTITWVRKPQ